MPHPRTKAARLRRLEHTMYGEGVLSAVQAFALRGQSKHLGTQGILYTKEATNLGTAIRRELRMQGMRGPSAINSMAHSFIYTLKHMLEDQNDGLLDDMIVGVSGVLENEGIKRSAGGRCKPRYLAPKARISN